MLENNNLFIIGQMAYGSNISILDKDVDIKKVTFKFNCPHKTLSFLWETRFLIAIQQFQSRFK